MKLAIIGINPPKIGLIRTILERMPDTEIVIVDDKPDIFHEKLFMIPKTPVPLHDDFFIYKKKKKNFEPHYRKKRGRKKR